jgi:hypothetical protein
MGGYCKGFTFDLAKKKELKRSSYLTPINKMAALKKKSLSN